MASTNGEYLFPGVKMEDVASEIDFTLVSVGSGNGSYEYRISQHISHPIVTVDPEPESYLKFPLDGQYIPPAYDYVENLIAHRPELIGNCILLLNWPNYEGENKSSYDFEAIEKLQPRKIIALYELYGGAGSNKLHLFMKKYGVPNKYYEGIGPCEGTLFGAKKTIVRKNKHIFGINTDVFVVLERL